MDNMATPATHTDDGTVRLHGATQVPESTSKQTKPDVNKQTEIIKIFKENVTSGAGSKAYCDSPIWRNALLELLELPSLLSQGEREKIKNGIKDTTDPQIVCYECENLIDAGFQKSPFALSSKEDKGFDYEKYPNLKVFLDRCGMGR